MNSSEPVRILVLMDYFAGPHGGTERQVFTLTSHHDPKDFTMKFMVFRHVKDYHNKEVQYPLEVKCLTIHRMLSLHTLLRMAYLVRFLRKERIQIVHIFFNDAAILAPLFCKLGGTKVITARRDMGFWYRPASLVALRLANRFVDRIVANCEAVKENVSRREKYSADKITVIKNTSDSARFLQPAQPGFREQWGIGQDDPIVGIAANISKVKRYPDLLRAFALVRKEQPEAWLIIAGGAGHKEYSATLTLALHLRIADRIRFLGSVPDPIPVIKHFDVCVLCSESEGLSNSIIEYLGSGKPVVCSATGGNVELVHHGQNGYLVSVGDVQQLAEYILAIITNSELALQLGIAARESFTNGSFSIDSSLRAHRALYTDLLKTS